MRHVKYLTKQQQRQKLIYHYVRGMYCQPCVRISFSNIEKLVMPSLSNQGWVKLAGVDLNCDWDFLIFLPKLWKLKFLCDTTPQGGVSFIEICAKTFGISFLCVPWEQVIIISNPVSFVTWYEYKLVTWDEFSICYQCFLVRDSNCYFCMY